MTKRFTVKPAQRPAPELPKGWWIWDRRTPLSPTYLDKTRALMVADFLNEHPDAKRPQVIELLRAFDEIYPAFEPPGELCFGPSRPIS